MENVEDIINELNKLNNMEISNLDKIIEKSNIEILDIERKVFNLKTQQGNIQRQHDFLEAVFSLHLSFCGFCKNELIYCTYCVRVFLICLD